MNVSMGRFLTRRKGWLAVVLLLAMVMRLGAADARETAVAAVAALTDPANVATLRTVRAANPRLLKCLYWLEAADGPPGEVIGAAQVKNGTAGQTRAPLVRDALLRNLDIAQKLGCLTSENLSLLRRGRSPVISQGPYAGEKAEVDHIVPRAHAPELENEFANLELMPATLNRRKSDKVGRRQLDWSEKFHAAGLLSDESLDACRFQYLLGFRGPVVGGLGGAVGLWWLWRRRRKIG